MSAEQNREIDRKRNNEDYARWRREAVASLGGRCVTCGYDGDLLDLDHIYGDGDSEPQYAKKGIQYFRNIIAGRITSVQLLCIPCHRVKTAENMDNLKSDTIRTKPWDDGQMVLFKS